MVTKEGVVLAKRSIEPCIGMWHIPGGTVYFGETPEMAVERVAMDELGVKVSINKLLGVITYPKMHADGYFGWPLGVAYEVTITDGTIRGSYQGEEVALFTSTPEMIIAEQADFLTSLGYLA